MMEETGPLMARIEIVHQIVILEHPPGCRYDDMDRMNHGDRDLHLADAGQHTKTVKEKNQNKRSRGQQNFHGEDRTLGEAFNF